MRSQLANFKLYEYVNAGPPILALAEGTEAGAIVGSFGGTVIRADDIPAITDALRTTARGELPPSDTAARADHAYPAVAERMEAAIELAIERRSK